MKLQKQTDDADSILSMTLDEYLALDDALTVAQLREEIGVKSDMQIRQWQHGYADRKPSPDYAVAIERATRGHVPVEKWNTTHRWLRIPDPQWPHPAGRPLIDPASPK